MPCFRAAAVQPLPGLPSAWGPPRAWSGLGRGPVSASPFPGALGRSCRKGMLTICWCSELAPYPGGAARCQSLVKTLARAALPVLGVSSVRIGVWPSLSLEGHPPRRLPRAPAGGPRQTAVNRVWPFVTGGPRCGVSQRKTGTPSSGGRSVGRSHRNRGDLASPPGASFPPRDNAGVRSVPPCRGSATAERGRVCVERASPRLGLDKPSVNADN